MNASILIGLASGSIRTVLIGAALACAGLAAAAAVPGKQAGADAPGTTFLSCSWDHPGHNPYMGDVVGTVDRYRDIPADVRERLKARMVKREYDDLVSIRRDSIEGRAKYGTTIRDMHFGTNQVCRSVTRAAWTPAMQERGLVYCDSGHCILVPTVCRNVSRITRAGIDSDRAHVPEVSPEVVGEVPSDPGAPAAATGPGEPLRADGFATALALDGGPSFGAPDEGTAGGGSGAPGSAGGAGGAGGGYGTAPGAGGPTISTAAIPPFGSDSVTPLPLPLAVAVPEPQTWALLLGGLAAVVAAARRRRSKS